MSGLRFQLSGQMARRKGDLEVVAPGIGVQVEHLAGKIETPDLQRFQRLGVHLRQRTPPAVVTAYSNGA